MSQNVVVTPHGDVIVPDPPFARYLFSSTKLAWLWLIVRIYVGWQWLSSGWGKVSGGVWGTGEGLRGFWTNATAIPAEGRPLIVYDWYRGFLQFMLENGWYTWFADVIMWGEVLVGIGLILGALTGIAAFFGAVMNWNFIMAGSASTNGFLLILAVLLMLAWKVAGWWGLDRWLLPAIGVPWGYADAASRPAPTAARR